MKDNGSNGHRRPKALRNLPAHDDLRSQLLNRIYNRLVPEDRPSLMRLKLPEMLAELHNNPDDNGLREACVELLATPELSDRTFYDALVPEFNAMSDEIWGE